MATLPTYQNLRVQQLSRVFENTTNSYKFYWFWSLLEQAQANTIIYFEELILDMVALSWHTVAQYKLSLGISDQLPVIIEQLLQLGDLKEHSTRQEVKKYLIDCSHKKNPSPAEKEVLQALKKLQNYVPFRFISPFFAGLPKSRKHYAIAEKSRTQFTVAEKTAPYKINLATSKKEPRSITIHPQWQEYLQLHHKILQEFCWWNFSQYLQSRNPNVPNINSKILPPNLLKRDLKTAKKFWKAVLTTTSLPCLYTQQPLQASWSIDHFVPWTFVLHDQLWNLLPTPNPINSSKSNTLPHSNYWEPFARLHYQAVQACPSAKLLEDYALLYRTTLTNLIHLPEEKFVQGLVEHLQPLMQQAHNLGFGEGWCWEE